MLIARLEKVSFAILALLAFLLPLAVWPWANLAADVEKRFLLLLGLGLVSGLWLIARLFDRELTFPKSWLVGALGMGLVIALISGLATADHHRALLGFGYESDTVFALAILGLAFLGGIIFVKTKERWFLVSLGLAAAGAVMVLFQIIQTIVVNLIGWRILPGGSFNLIGKWNELGYFAGLVVILTLAWLELLPRRNQKILSWFLLVTLILALLGAVMTNIWIMWILVTAGAAIILAAGWWQSRTLGKKPVWLKLSAAVVIIGLVFIILGQTGPLNNWLTGAVNRLGINNLEVNPSWLGTLSVFEGMAKTKPIFGVGPNSFNLAWNQFKPVGVNETPFWNTDFTVGVGFIPTFLITTGVAGALAWLAFLVLFVYSGFLAWSRPAIDEAERIFELMGFVAAAYLLAVLVIYPASTATIFLAFLLSGSFIGLLAARGLIPNLDFAWGKSDRFSFAGLIATIILLAVVASMLWFVTVQAAAAVMFTRSLQLSSVGNNQSAEAWAGRAVNLSGDEIFLRALVNFYLGDIQSLLNRTDLKPEQAQGEFQRLVQLAVTAGQAAVQKSPSNYANWVSLGHVYEVLVPVGVNNAYQAASDAYDRAIALNPTNPSLWLEKARLAVTAKNRAAALADANQALSLKPNYTDAVFLLAQLEAQGGNLAAAIKQSEQAAFLSPSDPVVFFQLGFLRYQANDFAGAAKALSQAVTLNPNYANARYFLGLAYDSLGQSDQALAQFKMVAQTNPNNQEVAQIISNLSAGRRALENTPPPPPKNRKNLPVKDVNQ